MNKRATSVILAGALGLGAGVSTLVVAPAVAAAAASETSVAEAVSDRVIRIRGALAGLVGDGSITQEQADEVATTLAEQLPRGGPGGHGGHGHHGGGPGGGRGGGPGLETAAEVLGTTADELRAALQSGQSLADVAAEQGVDRQTLVEELLAAGTERLEEGVAAGRLTQAEADERMAELAERVADQVDRKGLPSRGGHGPQPWAGDGAAAESDGSS